MEYTICDYEIEKIDANAIVFRLDENRNIIFNECIVLEGTGPAFFENIANNTTLDAVERKLLALFSNVNSEQLHKDVYDFANRLEQLGLLHWR